MSGVSSQSVTSKRRLFAIGAIAAMSGMVVAVACSFPDPQLVPDEGGTSADGTNDGTSSGGLDGSGDGTLPDVVEPDVAPPVDAAGEKPPVDAAGCLCDCDDDKYRSKDQDANACEAGIKAGDCDDLDPRANPDSGWVKAQPTKDTLGDWNCDTTVNREVAAVNVDCSKKALGIGCAGTEGFIGDPGCGEKGSYVICKNGTLSCENGTLEERTQGCK